MKEVDNKMMHNGFTSKAQNVIVNKLKLNKTYGILMFINTQKKHWNTSAWLIWIILLSY